MCRLSVRADGKRQQRDGHGARGGQVPLQPAVQHHGDDHAERAVLRRQPDGLLRRGLGHRPRPRRLVPAHEELRRQVAERAPVRRVVRDRRVRVLPVPGERGRVHQLRQGTYRRGLDFVGTRPFGTRFPENIFSEMYLFGKIFGRKVFYWKNVWFVNSISENYRFGIHDVR